MKLPLLCAALLLLGLAPPGAGDPAVLRSEFIYETPPTPQCHASTLAETRDGLVAAWFGGLHERDPSVGIWLSRHREGRWSTPVEVANGVQPDGSRLPSWNPVLFQPRGGPLMLFYKVGPSPSEWWGMLKTSTDGGRTWSAAQRLPDGVLGPIKDKPIQLPDGTILAGSSTEGGGLWRVHFERTPDLGRSWQLTRAGERRRRRSGRSSRAFSATPAAGSRPWAARRTSTGSSASSPPTAGGAGAR